MSTTITIAGLGYGSRSARTLSVQSALDAAQVIMLRTAVHPGIEDLKSDPRVVACDDLYETSVSFDSVYGLLVDRVVSAAMTSDVLYAVPGSAVFGERTIAPIRERAKGLGIAVEIMPAVSALEPVAIATGLDLLGDQIQIIDAMWLSERVRMEPFSGGQLQLDPFRPLIVGQIYDQTIAGDVKHALSRLYGDDYSVSIVRNAGILGEEVVTLAHIYEIDRIGVDHLTTLVVPAVEWPSPARSPATLHQLIAHLRSPEGCPWDRKQTFASLRDKVLEEAHETIEAIDSKDADALAGELGDLLLVAALLAQIADEAGEFEIEDVYHQVNAKLFRRHPHVFGDTVAESAEDVLATWKSVKASERGDLPGSSSVRLRFDELPATMSVVDRIRLSEVPSTGHTPLADQSFGEELLSMINKAHSAGIDPERSLEAAYRISKLGDNLDVKGPAQNETRA